MELSESQINLLPSQSLQLLSPGLLLSPWDQDAYSFTECFVRADEKRISFVNTNFRFNTVAPPYLWRCDSVQSLNRVRLFATPWSAARQAPLSSTNSWSLLKLMSTELMMPSNHLILCYPLLLLPLIFPRSRAFSNEPVLRIWWPGFQRIPKSTDAQALI